jgi:hypothetical protein
MARMAFMGFALPRKAASNSFTQREEAAAPR